MPKISKRKIAFIGAPCSGKTTTTMRITAELKELGVNAVAVVSEDEKLHWNWRYFPETPIAHHGAIAKQIYAETAASLRDVDIVVSDRSILDLASIAITDHPKFEIVFRNLIDTWIDTYDNLFYLSPLPYVEDGKRPPNEFRMKTHETLVSLMKDYSSKVIQVEDRTTLINRIGNVIYGVGSDIWKRS